MVYRGRLSPACAACREARVKCDLQQPSCSRCSRLGKLCHGYREATGLRICNQTEEVKVKQEYRGRERTARLPSTSMHVRPTYLNEDEVVWYFHHRTMASLSVTDHAYYLHCELPRLYPQSLQGSALRLSAQAIAHAVSCSANRSTPVRARRWYARAMAAVSTALHDPDKVKSDETLYAVLLLSGYETITGDSMGISGWASHTQGAAILLAQRNIRDFVHPFSFALYHFARRSVILYHIQSCKPFSTTFGGLDYSAPLDRSDDHRLFSLMAKLSDILHQYKVINDERESALNDQLSMLFASATVLDCQYVQWAGNLDPAWATKIVPERVHQFDSKFGQGYEPGQNFEYGNCYVARLWNLYRASRIILLSLTMCIQNLAIFHSTIHHHTLDLEHLKRTILELVDDLCAGVPWQLQINARTPRPAQASHPFQYHFNTEPSKAYSLLWPLRVASSVRHIPEFQRAWLRGILRKLCQGKDSWITHPGAYDCQNLVGRAEIFMLDCV